MVYEPITPFRRAVDAVQIAHATRPRLASSPALLRVDKWEVLRNATLARKRLGVSDRNLTVLQALLSFVKGSELSFDDSNRLIVHPANETISGRLNGMPASTLRRHLSALVDAGLIVRRDSPNGKRYVRRYTSGDRHVFGLDLSPLLTRASEISEIAEVVRAEEEARKRLRQTVSLMRRDLDALVIFGRASETDFNRWDEIADLIVLTGRCLRRATDDAGLKLSKDRLESAINSVRSALRSNETSVDDAHYERQYQNSTKGSLESENIQMCIRDPKSAPVKTTLNESLERAEDKNYPAIDLDDVLTVCTEVAVYAPVALKSWTDFIDSTRTVRPMMGISDRVWREAEAVMGVDIASVTIAAILQRFEHIKNPNGYLKALLKKSNAGSFDCRRMINALRPSAAEFTAVKYTP